MGCVPETCPVFTYNCWAVSSVWEIRAYCIGFILGCVIISMANLKWKDKSVKITILFGAVLTLIFHLLWFSLCKIRDSSHCRAPTLSGSATFSYGPRSSCFCILRCVRDDIAILSPLNSGNRNCFIAVFQRSRILKGASAPEHHRSRIRIRFCWTIIILYFCCCRGSWYFC